MQGSSRFRPNSPPLIQETIEQETIMVNLETGAYYSLNMTGSHVWSSFESGASVAETGETLAARFDVSRETADSELAAFVERLIGDELIVERTDEEATAEAPPGAGDAKAPYETPQLSKYTDMQELLLLDPVHDVGAAGWPAQN